MMQGWVAACPLATLEARALVPVTLAGRQIVILLSEGRVHASERACPHEGADLAEGWCALGRLHCPHHRASFDLESGAVSPGWRVRPLRTYPTEVREGTVFVALDDRLSVVSAFCRIPFDRRF